MFKPGDRIKAKVRPDVVGTVRDVNENGVLIALDEPISTENDEGKRITQQEGYLTKEQTEQVFDIIEKSDWADLWDKGST